MQHDVRGKASDCSGDDGNEGLAAGIGSNVGEGSGDGGTDVMKVIMGLAMGLVTLMEVFKTSCTILQGQKSAENQFLNVHTLVFGYLIIILSCL